MGIPGAWTLEAVVQSTINADNVDEALEAAKPYPATVLLDGGMFYTDWMASVSIETSVLKEVEIRQQDFADFVLHRATARFHKRIEATIRQYRRKARHVLVCWDNSSVIAVAKQEVYEARRARREENKKEFYSLLIKIIMEQTGTKKPGRENGSKFADLRRRLAAAGTEQYGPMPLPASTVREEDGMDLREAMLQHILHLRAVDEADLLIARIVRRDPNAFIVVTEDSDVLFTVNCRILRSMRRGKFQVTDGLRSAYYMLLAQLVGQDYTNNEGIPGLGSTTAKMLLDAIAGSQLQTDVMALLGQLNIVEGPVRQRLIRALEIWNTCSHGGEVIQATQSILSSQQFRSEARSQHIEATQDQSDQGNSGPLVFAVPLDRPPPPFVETIAPQVSMRLLRKQKYVDFIATIPDKEQRKEQVQKELRVMRCKEKRKQSAISKKHGHECRQLPQMQFVPTHEEVPLDVGNQAFEEEVNEDANRTMAVVGGPLHVTTNTLRLPATVKGSDRTDLGFVYPRSTHNDTLHMMVERYSIDGVYQLHLKSHPDSLTTY